MNGKSNLTKEEKHTLLTKVVADLFCTVGPDDVLFREKDGKWILGTRPLTEAQLKQYAEEASIIKNMFLWKEIDKCIKYLNNRAMFLRGKTEDDYIAGKMVLFVLKTIDDILNKAQNLL